MAIHANSTTAPARPLLPARDARGRFVKLASVVPANDTPELPPEPLLPAMAPRRGAPLARHRDSPRAVASDVLHGAAREVCATVAQIPFAPAEGDGAEAARALHLRRALEEAAEHAAAMLPALGLPRLVAPGFAPIDREVALDALDAAIVELDALDGDPDLEPWLGWTGAAIGRAEMGDTLDREAEDLDEFTLGWSGFSQLRLSACDDGFDPLDRGEASVDDGPQDDNELDDDGLSRSEGDAADDEPNLGAPDGDGDQRRWAQGPSHADDPEADDADLDDDRTAEDSALRVWVFGPSRREAAHA